VTCGTRRLGNDAAQCGAEVSDNLIFMRRLTATEAARRFSELLDAVEDGGESFLVLRHGRAVARIGPATGARGATVKSLLRTRPKDRTWARELRELRADLTPEERRWRD
jgi:prevent-host-death family protein